MSSRLIACLALALGFALVASLEVPIHATHAQSCESVPGSAIVWTDANVSVACPAAGKLWCMKQGNVTSANGTPGDLRLVTTGGASTPGFRAPIPVDLGAGAGVSAITAADFDHDGWVDLVGTMSDVVSASRYLVFIRNMTKNNVASIDWNDPTSVATPSFAACTDTAAPNANCPKGYLNGEDYSSPQGPTPSLASGGATALVSGRFDRADSIPDVFLVRGVECGGLDTCLYQRPDVTLSIYRGDGAGQFTLQTASLSVQGDNASCDSNTATCTCMSTTCYGCCNEYAELDWPSTNMLATDWEGDGDDDILFVRSQESNSDVLLLLNTTTASSSTVTFDGPNAVSNLPLLPGGGTCTGGANDFCKRGPSSLAYVDLDGNGSKDLVAGYLGSTWKLAIRRASAPRDFSGFSTVYYCDLADSTNGTNDGANTFVLGGDLDGGAYDLLLGMDNWNFAASAPCDVSRDSTAGGCADTNRGGITRFLSSKDANGLEAGWTWTSATCAAQPAKRQYLSCHGEGSPFATPPVNCGGITHTAHAESREGQATGTANVIYDWDSAVLINYDDDYDCTTGDQPSNPDRHPGYSVARGLAANPGACPWNEDVRDTVDMIVADGNESQRIWVFPSRSSGTSYAACGADGTNNWTGWSDVISPGVGGQPGTTTDAVESACVSLTSATIPTNASGAADVDIELSNDGGVTSTFVESAVATASVAGGCPAGASTCYCANFRGRDRRVAWRTRLCPTPDLADTPRIVSTSMLYRYAPQTWQLHSGVTVAEGMKYVAQYQHPGNEGRLLAYQVSEDQSDSLAWVVKDGTAPTGLPGQSAATVVKALPANASRQIYTLIENGSGCTGSTTGDWQLLEFSWTSADSDARAELRRLMGGASCVDKNTAKSLINWARCGNYSTANPPPTCTGRFGPAGANSRLGGFYRSTPAVLTAPKTPYWRGLATTHADENAAIDDLVSDLTARGNLVVVGSRDGMLHAFFSNPDNPQDANNGTEVWAFIPPSVVAGLNAEYTDSDPVPQQDLWVDGSPRLYDFWDGSTAVTDGISPDPGGYRTALIFGMGFGGQEYFALDITETTTSAGACISSCAHGSPCATTLCGLRILWRYLDAVDTGRAISQPTMVRVETNPAPTPSSSSPSFRAVFGSGSPATAASSQSTSRLKSLELRSGAMTTGWPATVSGLPAGVEKRFFQASPVAVDTRTTVSAYTSAGDGSTDYIVLGDTGGYIWRVPVAGGTITPYYSAVAGEPITASASVFQGASDAWFLVGTGGFDQGSTMTAGKIAAVQEASGVAKFAPVTLAGAGDQVYVNIAITDDNCYVATAKADFLDTGGCIDPSGSLYKFNCSTGGTLSSITGIPSGSARSALFIRGGVLTYATTHGDMVSLGSGTGRTTVPPGTQNPITQLWWREVW